MRKTRRSIFAVMTTLVLLVVMAFKPGGQAILAAEQTVKIMPLGDSITDCDFWRTLLFNKLIDNGYNVQSVGTRPGNHEGHWGIKVTDIADYNQLVPWLEASNPDVIMMHLGTNDCWQNVKTSKIIEAYTKLIGQMRANNPNVIIVVAQIIPLHPDDQIDYAANVNALNAAIPEWAAGLTTEASPIIVCDQYTGFNVEVDTYDGAHPSGSGSQKICDNWYKVLAPILSGETPEPVETPEPTPATEDLVLEAVPSNWGSGYTMTIKIKNNSDRTVTDWSLKLKKADFDITNIWCANANEEDEEIVITPMGWNSTISAGGFVEFGFQGNGTVEKDFSYTLK